MSRRHARQGESKKSGALGGPNAQGFLVALLAEVSARSLTCRIQVSSKKTLRRVFFMEGRPVAFWSDHPEDAFGRRFVDSGLIDGKALRWTQQHLGKEERIEEALVAGQLLTWPQVAQEQARHIEQGVDALSRMKDGEWEFRLRPEVAGRIEVPLPVASIHASLWREEIAELGPSPSGLGGWRGSVSLYSSPRCTLLEVGEVPKELMGLQEGATLEEVLRRCRTPPAIVSVDLVSRGSRSRESGWRTRPKCSSGLVRGWRGRNSPKNRSSKSSQKRAEMRPQWSLSSRSFPKSGDRCRFSRSRSSEEDDTPLGKGEEVPVSDWREKEVPDNRGLSLGRAEDDGHWGLCCGFVVFGGGPFRQSQRPWSLGYAWLGALQSNGGEETEEALGTSTWPWSLTGNMPKPWSTEHGSAWSRATWNPPAVLLGG